MFTCLLHVLLQESWPWMWRKRKLCLWNSGPGGKKEKIKKAFMSYFDNTILLTPLLLFMYNYITIILFVNLIGLCSKTIECYIRVFYCLCAVHVYYYYWLLFFFFCCIVSNCSELEWVLHLKYGPVMMINGLHDVQVLPKIWAQPARRWRYNKGPRMQFCKGLAPCNVHRLTWSTPQIIEW